MFVDLETFFPLYIFFFIFHKVEILSLFSRCSIYFETKRQKTIERNEENETYFILGRFIYILLIPLKYIYVFSLIISNSNREKELKNKNMM